MKLVCSSLATALALAVPLTPAAPVPLLAPGDTVSYRAKPGDTLYVLARDYCTGLGALPALQQLNRIADPRRLPIGREIRIPRELLRFTPVTLRLASFSGPVMLAGSASQARLGQVLAEGDRVATGPNGFVLIAGSDGSRLALPSNSAARIGRARHYLLVDADDLAVALDSGRGAVEAAHQKPQGRFQLQTPVAVSAVRGTHFHASFDPQAGSATTGVTEGLVAVSAGKAELGIPAGQGAVAARDGALRQEALLGAPAVATPGRVQTEPTVDFTLAPLASAARYHLQLARDAGFTDLLAEIDSPGPSVSFSGINNGSYFLRASAIAPSGLEGLSETHAFRRQRVGLKADVGQVDIPGALRFNWAVEGEGTSSFRFQLFPASGTTPLIDEAGLAQPGLTLTGLKPGAYRWRVGVTQTVPEGRAELWSPLNPFTFGG